MVRPDTARFRRRRPAEFVEALGRLYGRSRAVSPAWSALSDLSRKVLDGVPVARLRVAAADGPDRASRLREALEPQGSPGERELVRLARALADVLEPSPASGRGRAEETEGEE